MRAYKFIAISFCIAAPFTVYAETKLYGQAQIEVANWGGDAKGTSVEDNARGRIGIMATEELADGMTGLVRFEFKIDTADGVSSASSDASLTKREMMVGIKGNFGEVQLGRIKTAYKYSGGVTYDPFVATVLEARGNNGMTGKVGVGALDKAAGHFAFVDDSVAYVNKWDAVSVWLTYDLDDGGKTSDTGGNALSAALKFVQENWEVFVTTINDDNDGAAGQGYDSTKVGGMYKINGTHKVSAQFEAADNGGTDEDVFYINYGLSFGKNLLDVSVGDFDQDQTGVDSRSFARVALKHNYSEQTSTWIGYRVSDTGNTTDESVIAIGIRKVFK